MTLDTSTCTSEVLNGRACDEIVATDDVSCDFARSCGLCDVAAAAAAGDAGIGVLALVSTGDHPESYPCAHCVFGFGGATCSQSRTLFTAITWSGSMQCCLCSDCHEHLQQRGGQHKRTVVAILSDVAAVPRWLAPINLAFLKPPLAVRCAAGLRRSSTSPSQRKVRSCGLQLQSLWRTPTAAVS